MWSPHLLMGGVSWSLLAVFSNNHIVFDYRPVSGEGSRTNKYMTLGLCNFTLLFSLLRF